MAAANNLSPRHRAFVREYLVDHIGAQAAIRAGYAPKNARTQASQLLSHPDIRAAIHEAEREAAEQAGITLARVMQEFAKMAFTDMSTIVTWDGPRVSVKPSANLTAAEAATIMEVAETESKSGQPQMRVKLYSRQQALESLLKCLQTMDLEARILALEQAMRENGSGRFK